VVVRWKLCEFVISTVCGAVAVSGAQLAAPSTDAAVSISTVAVPPGCTSQPTHVGFERRPQCVAKANVKTRGYGIGRCITDPRTLDLSYATYTYGDCRGTKLIQAEAIAQARAIVNLNLMLAGYNAGPYAVLNAGGIPQNGQTPGYVTAITARAAHFADTTGVVPGGGRA